MKNIFRYGALLALSLFLIGCGSESPNSINSGSNYIIVNNKNSAGLANYVHKTDKDSVIKVCFKANGRKPRFETDNKKGKSAAQIMEEKILEWIRPMKEKFPNKQFVDKVIVETGNCSTGSGKSHVSIEMKESGYRSNCSLGRYPSIRLGNDKWYGSSTVLLHELGHAYGLLDTYSGNGCKSNQKGPAKDKNNTVMCKATYETLKEDDEYGVLSVYNLVYNQPNKPGTIVPNHPKIVY